MNPNLSAATRVTKRSRRSASPDGTKEPPKLKAVLDGRHLPIELFGYGRARYIRKLVYNYIATWADPDGTDAYPSLETIARDCGLTVRGLRDVISWLEEHGLIRVEYKASSLGTNRYTVLFSEEDQAACWAALKRDEEQQRLRIKAEQTSVARSLAANARWAKHKAKSTGDQEQCLLAEQSGVKNAGFLEHQERIASDGERFACEQGTDCMEPGTHGSHNRPLNRPEVNRQIVPSATPSTIASRKMTPPSPPSRPAAADVADDVLASSLNTDGQNPGAAFDHDRFMADVCDVLDEGYSSTASTQSHRERAFAMASEHGRELFIAALEHWLDEEGHLMRKIPMGEDPRSGKPRIEERKWVLDYFMSSGAAVRYIKRVEAVFALGVKSPKGIEIVSDLLQRGHRLTPEQAQALARLSNGEDGLAVMSVCEGVSIADSVDDFLSSPKEWVERYWAQRRGESAAK